VPDRELETYLLCRHIFTWTDIGFSNKYWANSITQTHLQHWKTCLTMCTAIELWKLLEVVTKLQTKTFYGVKAA
jgi:hypothetical protein